MKKTWYNEGRTEDQRIEAGLKRFKLPFRKRVDVVWFLLFFSFFFIFILWWLVGVLLGHRFGYFDPPPVHTIEDSRILVNLRDNIRQYPLLDAVFHTPDGHLYLSQSGGQVHRYHPGTGLWETEIPYSADLSHPGLSNPGLVLLRSGCGADPLSNRVQICRDNQSLWGLTVNSGLVRRGNDRWEIVKGDSLFIGSGGKPVKQGQLTTAAVSEKGEWLVVGSLQDGFGIYHVPTHGWLPVPKELTDRLPSRHVSHAAWNRERFWLGGPSGLVSMRIVDNQPVIETIPAVTGTVLDLDVDPAGRLWVLERRNCKSGGSRCIRLSRFDGPGADAQVLVAESNVFFNLTLDDLLFAAYRAEDHRLLAAGSAGLYSYDTRFHNWERHFRGAVHDVLPLQDDTEGFYFSFTGGIGLVAEGHLPWRKPNKRCTTWPLPGTNINEKIIALQHGETNEVLALGLSGKVFALDPTKPKSVVELVFSGTGTVMDAKDIINAASFGDYVLFVGGNRAMVHNIVDRTYTNVSTAKLPEWLKQPGLKMLGSGSLVYALIQKRGYTNVYKISKTDAALGNFSNAKLLAAIEGSPGRIMKWKNMGVGMITNMPDGRVFRFTTGKEYLTGPAAPSLHRTPLLDAAGFQNGVIIASSEGLWPYNYSTRSWGRFRRFYGNSFPKEVVSCDDRLFMSTLDGKLLELNINRRFDTLIGGDSRFDMTDSDLNDVVADGDRLFLAGNGRVNLYDMELRSVTDSWLLPGENPISLIGVVRNQPLSVSGGKAYVGTQVLDYGAGRVINISMDKDYIWAVRQKNRPGQPATRYLKRYPVTDPFSLAARCYFYNPYSGRGTRQVLDAVTLTDETVVVSTDRGLRFYNPAARSWILDVRKDPLPRGGRLYLLGKQLVFAAESSSNVQLTVVDTDALLLPSGCSEDPVVILRQPKTVNAYVVDPGQERLTYIGQNGAVTQWHGEVEIEILPPTGEAPLSNSLKRVFKHTSNNSNFLTFTPANGRNILRYNLEKRRWSTIPLNMPGGAENVVDIDCETGAYTQLVTAKTRSGSLYLGSIDLLAPNATTVQSGVDMKQVYTPRSGFGYTGADLVDVQMQGAELWIFVLNDRIKYYNAAERAWSGDILIPGGTGSSTFYLRHNRGVMVSGNKDTWWVARRTGLNPGGFARYDHTPGESAALDETGAIWRLHSDGTLFHLQLPEQGDYRDPEVAYEKPYVLAKNSVDAAYEWGKRIIFSTPGGIRVLDTILRQDMALPRAAEQVKGIKEILSERDRVWIRTGSDRLLLLTYGSDKSIQLEGRLFTGKISDLEEQVEELQDRAFSKPVRLPDRRQKLKQRIVRLPDGREVFDPVTGFVTDSSGQLMAQRPGGRELLAQAGSASFKDLPPALDTGWLKWNRNNRRFEVKTPSGIISKRPEEFIQEGKLLFEEVDALLAMDSNRLYAANKHGIWSHSRMDLGLNDSKIVFHPLDWSGPYAAAHGKLISANRIYTVNNKGQPVSNSSPLHTLNFGDVTLSEHLRDRGVTGRIKGGKNAFAARGFLWDSNKRGLAYNSTGKLLVHSDAGIHLAQGYTGFEPFPPGTSQQGRLYSPTAGEIYFQQGNTWHRRTGPGKWASASDPLATRTLVDNSTWRWELRNNTLRIRFKEANHNFNVEWSSEGLSFTSDLLQDAYSFNNRLAVITRAFTEITDDSAPNQLSFFQSPAYAPPPVPVDKLQRTVDNQANHKLVLLSRGQQYVWNDSSKAFKRDSDDPGQKGLRVHVPLTNPRLRFTRTVSSTGYSRIKKELKVNDISGREYWVPFNFINGRFPFDVVTSLAAREVPGTQSNDPTAAPWTDSELYIGTAAGLQVYTDKKTGNLSTRLEDMTNCYQLRSGTDRLTPVKTVGIPLDNKNVVKAYAPGMCIERVLDGTFRQCSPAVPLTRRWRYGSDRAFWQLINNNGRLEVRYRNHTGQFISAPAAAAQGRFLHDNVVDLAIYNGKPFTLWRSGWISRHSNNNLELQEEGRVVNFNTRAMAPRRFIKADGKLYFEGTGRRLWHYNEASSTWEEEKDSALASTILREADLPYIVKRDRLRLLEPSPGQITPGKSRYNFEYKDGNEQWRPMTWKNNRLAIDMWSQFFYVDGRLWAATPEGLVRFSRSPTKQGVQDRIVLNLDASKPDSFRIIREPLVNNKIPVITDIEAVNNIVTLRCSGKSSLVFRGTLEKGKDANVFTRLDIDEKDKAGDPFASKIQVSEQDNGFWEWVREGRSDFNPGRLKVRLKGEEVQLVGGKFSFDTINSIAFFKDEVIAPAQNEKDAAVSPGTRESRVQVEIGTDSGGWYYSEGKRFDLAGFQRPKTPGVNAANVKEVRTNLSPEGEKILGLRTSGREFIRIDKEGVSGKTRQFLQFLCSDGFWHYMQESKDNPLSIVATRSSGSSGQVKRQMENGRFSDDIILGLPVHSPDAGAGYYLVPTGAGILKLDAALKTRDIYAKSILSVVSGKSTAPHVLYMEGSTGNPRPLYLADGRFLPIPAINLVGTGAGTSTSASGGLDETISSLTPYLPANAVVLAVENGPQDFIRVRWQKQGRRGWTLLNPKDTTRVEEHNSIYVDLSRFDKYISNRQKWGDIQPWMRFRMTENNLEFLLHQAPQPFRIPFSPNIDVLAAIVNKQSLLLIGTTNLWEINLEYAMEKGIESRQKEVRTGL
jgi:hypothetical protein